MKSVETTPDFGSRYLMEEKLGAGAQGAVYLVRDRNRNDARLALKVLAGNSVGGRPQEWLDLFRWEFEALAGLSHPRIAKVHDFGSTRDGETFFTRDFVEGSDLMTATAGIDLDEFVVLAAEVCRALAPLHRARLVHGDIKPGNLIVGADGIARLIDFSFLGSSGQDAVRRGTCHYMAPEVIEKKTVDVRSDLYALGASFFEILSGKPMFEGSVREVLSGHLGVSRPALEFSRIRAGSPEILAGRDDLAAVVERMTAPDPDERFPDLEEVEAALTAIAPGLIKRDPVPPAPITSGAWGRDVEVRGLLEKVVSRLDTPQDHPAVHVVTGGPGTGKTALLRTLKWMAQLRGITVIDVRCGSERSMLGPVADLARQASQILSGSPGEAARAARLLETLESPVERGLDLDSLAAGVGDLITWSVRRGPLLILLDNVDQAAPETLDLLGVAVARVEQGKGPAVVCSASSGFEWLERLGDGPGTTLPNLDRDGVRKAVEQFFKKAEGEAVDRVLEHTGGNPLFVHTLLADLFAAGDGLERLDALGPPMGLETYWRERLGLLGEIEREVLEACSVCGVVTTLDRIAEVVGRSDEETSDAVSSLARSGWLRESGEGWSVKTVPMAREVLGLAREDRLIILHRRAIETERDDARRMMHAAACGDRKTLEEGGEAVAAALEKMGALETAGKIYAALDKVIGNDRFTVARGRIAVARSDHVQATSLLEPLVSSEDPFVKSKALLLLGEIHMVTRSYADALSRLQGALDLSDRDSARAEILAKLANVHFRTGDIERGREVAHEGLDLVQVGSTVKADLLGLLGLMSVAEAKHDRALSLCSDAVSLARTIQDRRALALAMDRLAWACQQSGDLDRAVENLVDVVDLNREIGDMRRLMRAQQALGDLYWWKEDWSLSLARYEDASRLVGLVGSKVQGIEVRIGLGWALNNVGRFERAALVLEEARREAARMGLDELELRALVFEGDNRAWQGRTEEAISRWSQALEGLEPLGKEGICAEIELEMAEALLRRQGSGDVDRAAGLVRSAQARKREDLGRRFDDLLDLVDGVLDLAKGRFEHGVGKLDRLIGRLEETGARDLIWQSHLAVAREMAERGADVLARKRLRMAEGILAELASRLPSEHRLAFWQDVRRAEVRRLLAVTVPSSRIGIDVPRRSGGKGGTEAEVESLYRVLDFNKRLASETEVGRLIEAILDAAIDLTGAERGFVLMPGDGGLEVRAARELGNGEARDPHEQFSRSIAESVFLDGEAVVTVDASGDERFNEFVSIHELKVRSVASVPVTFRGSSLGVLYLENRLRRGRFGGTDLRVLSAFSDQVAIAISQARMLDEAKDRQEQLSRATADLEALCARQAEDLREKRTDLKLVEERFERIRQRVEGQGDFHGVVGSGAAMQRVFDMMERVSDLDIPVVFVGESGTGKDLLARVLHDIGSRRLGPFVPVTCGGVPENLVEATLFGHVQGAFSGADKERMGMLASSTGGTLYLDDIGEMPPRMQVDLLRVLQEGCYTPLGANDSIRTDFRLIASSRENPELLVEQGLLRQDLFYRLQVLSIDLPPLRERKEDLAHLARRIIVREANRLGREPRPLSRDALEAITAHQWGGNVRELEQIIRRALVISGDEEELNSEALFGKGPQVSGRSENRGRKSVALHVDEERKILDALESCQWNRSQAAKKLGIPRRTFYRRLEKLGLTHRR